MKISEKKHLAIVEAAKQEFIEYGFSSANMDRLCTAAGVSKRTLYRHFQSKEVLFTAVLQAIYKENVQSVSYVFHPEQTLLVQLCSIIEDEIHTLHYRYGIPLSRMILKEFLANPELAKHYLDAIYDNDNILQNWITEAIQHGRIANSTNTELASSLLSNLFHGQFFWPQIVAHRPLPEAAEQQKKIYTIAEMFIRMFAKDPEKELLTTR
ncbi:TetR/AcrR family transcriptional regulator [Parasalinivibrio latis]|uniref:TetR/AcrR family transcriptional regulator n=1 Tax=Parasalinivibrio latis TaxID=2952610 RepID=UPI0030DEB3CE